MLLAAFLLRAAGRRQARSRTGSNAARTPSANPGVSEGSAFFFFFLSSESLNVCQFKDHGAKQVLGSRRGARWLQEGAALAARTLTLWVNTHILAAPLPSPPKTKAGEEEQGDPRSAQPAGQQHQEVQQEPCSAPCRLRAAAGAGTWPCRQRAAHREQPWAQAASIKEHRRRPPSRRQAGRAVCTAAARPAALQACSSPHGRQEARQPRRESASAGVGMAPRAAPARGQSPAVPPG